MSREEKLHEAGLRSERQRRAYRWSRALIRTVLSGYCAVEPLELRFATSPAGKPRVELPEGTGLEFSLAHTEGIAVLLVGRDRAVGVDVESERRPLSADLPRRLLGPGELEGLRALPPARRSVRFLEHWTLKEAYAKARGSGLELPLAGWQFAIDERGVRPRLDPAPERWWFALAPSAPGFVIALAASLHAAGEAAPVVEAFRANPAAG